MSQLANIYVAVEGCDPIFIGELNSAQTFAFAEELAYLGVTCFVDDTLEVTPPIRLRANEDEMGFDLSNIDWSDLAPKLLTLADRQWMNKKTLLRKKCTVGYNAGQDIQYPISYKSVEEISLNEAGVNLAIFDAALAAKLPMSVIEEMAESRYVSQEFIDSLPSNEQKSVSRVVTNLVGKILKGNTKLRKNKIPAAVGIGKPSGMEGFNEAPTFGSVGLNLMNARSMTGGEDVTGLDSIRSVAAEFFHKAQEIIEHEERQKKPDRSAINKCLKMQVSFRIMEECLDGFTKNASSCQNATNGCYAPCLVTSGRQNSITDPFGDKGPSASLEGLKGGVTRMSKAYIHCAFLANPYYFLRLLIEAIYIHAKNHVAQICVYNGEAYIDPDLDPIMDIEDYLNKIPPSVRLNVYSDYVWERIYTDLFSLFDRKRPKVFRGVGGSYAATPVMFYDYTKNPGRWSTKQRKKLFKSLDLEWDPKYAYKLPDNYHLTYSFAGSRQSYAWSKLANMAGQNSTFVFSTMSLMHESISKALKITGQSFGGKTGMEIRKSLDRLDKRLYDILERVFGSIPDLTFDIRSITAKGTQPLVKAVGEGSTLPSALSGVPVISGDFYDIRYLDTYLQKRGNAVVVGLAWKPPANVKLKVGNTSYALEPALCTLFLSSPENVDNADLGVGFGIPRYVLGRGVEFKVGAETKLLSMYAVAKSPSQVSTQELMRDLSEADVDRLGEVAISHVTQTGSPMNFDIGAHSIQFLVTNVVAESAEVSFDSLAQ